MMTEAKLIQVAKDAGFSYTVRLDPTTLIPQQDVRDMCRCGRSREGRSSRCHIGCSRSGT